MQRMGHQRLAGAGFAVDQHMAIGLAQIQNILAHPVHQRRGADQLFHQHGAVAQLPPQGAVVQRQAAALAGLFRQFGHPVGVEGLFQKIIGPDPHRLYRHRHIAVAGDQNDRQSAVHAHQAFQERHAIHAGHSYVADHHAGIIGADPFQRLFGRAIGFGVEPRQRQPLADRLPHVQFIVNDRNFHGTGHLVPFGGGYSAASA